MRKTFALLALLFPATLLAQSGLVIAPQNCVWHAGDDPRWSAPQLDETGWLPFANNQIASRPAQFWLRCHIGLGGLASVQQPEVQVGLYAAYQLYLDGTLLGTAGNIGNGNITLDATRSYLIPPSMIHAQPATLALRITHRQVPSNGMINRTLSLPMRFRAGDHKSLAALRAADILDRGSESLPTAICYLIIGVISVMLFGLYLFDRTRTEFVLLSLCGLSLAALRINEFCAAAQVPFPLLVCVQIVVLGNVVFNLCQIPFYFVLAGRRTPTTFKVIIALAVLLTIPNGVQALIPQNFPWWDWLSFVVIRRLTLLLHLSFCTAPFIAFWPFLRGNNRIKPLALLCIAWSLVDLVWFALQVTDLPVPGVPNLFATWGLTLLDARAFATASVLTAILALLFRDQRQVTQERALFAGELLAARNVQQYLIPAHLPSTPGFSVASEYRPARDVGGDFFQILPQHSDGSLLIVVGDVAGKGIEAGMLATLIVGSVRTAASFTSDPARILALLNDRLCGRGLVTCLALRIEQDGNATLVNAGHLPPYLNGKELPVDGALPLGAVLGTHFPSSQFTLAADDSLLLMTDGVVEAQDAHGRLFGFDRIAALLHSGADGAALANAAQTFGQNDDITVLSVTFAPAEVLHA